MSKFSLPLDNIIVRIILAYLFLLLLLMLMMLFGWLTGGAEISFYIFYIIVIVEFIVIGAIIGSGVSIYNYRIAFRNNFKFE